jgi:HPt (histidine-containing phosphotransfer) domain-containing protein
MDENKLNASLQHFHKAYLIDMVGENQDFINLLIKTYFEGFYKYIIKIRQAVHDQNQEALKLNAHSITGSSKSVCFEIMAKLAFDLENTEVSKIDEINDLIEEMENELEIIKEIITLE